jgi:hypothetical protein
MYRSYKFRVLAVFLSCLARASAQPVVSAESTDPLFTIDCKSWFNAQPVDLFEHPRAILLAFWSVRSPTCRALVAPLNRLRARYGRRLDVVGITEDQSREVRWYIERNGVRYKIGAELEGTRRYNVGELPVVLLIDTSQRRIIWRGSGPDADPEAVRKAVEGFLGTPADKDRSEKLLAEEVADSGMLRARVQRAEAEVEALVSQAIAGALKGTLLEPDDLNELDLFYEAKLPSDANGSEAPSERAARGRVCGYETGYGALLKSGRLSGTGTASVYGRLLSIAAADPSPSIRLTAVHTLRRSVGKNADATLFRQLKDLLDVETNAFARGALEQALDQLNPQATPAEKAGLTSPTSLQLSRMLAESSQPASSRWADAHLYIESVADQDSQGLIEDYWANPDTKDDIVRENATLKRSAAMSELSHRIIRGEVSGSRELRSTLIDILWDEPDAFIRGEVAGVLHELGRRGNSDDRAQILNALEAQLAAETHTSHMRAELEMYAKELRSRR